MPVTSRAAVAVPPAYAACPAGLAAAIRRAVGQSEGAGLTRGAGESDGAGQRADRKEARMGSRVATPGRPLAGWPPR